MYDVRTLSCIAWGFEDSDGSEGESVRSGKGSKLLKMSLHQTQPPASFLKSPVELITAFDIMEWKLC